jgi:hypothetical protein
MLYATAVALEVATTIETCTMSIAVSVVSGFHMAQLIQYLASYHNTILHSPAYSFLP